MSINMLLKNNDAYLSTYNNNILMTNEILDARSGFADIADIQRFNYSWLAENYFPILAIIGIIILIIIACLIFLKKKPKPEIIKTPAEIAREKINKLEKNIVKNAENQNTRIPYSEILTTKQISTELSSIIRVYLTDVLNMDYENTQPIRLQNKQVNKIGIDVKTLTAKEIATIFAPALDQSFNYSTKEKLQNLKDEIVQLFKQIEALIYNKNPNEETNETINSTKKIIELIENEMTTANIAKPLPFID